MSGGLDDRRNAFFARWPIGRVLDEALRTANNQRPLFYFADCDNPDLHKCTWVLGRLGGPLETQFGIASEVLILFTKHRDLQRRTFNALTERLRDEVRQQQRIAHEGQVRFTPDPLLSLLYAPDPRAAEKVENWNLEGASSLVVTVPSITDDPETLRARLRSAFFSVLSERDLYQGRHPVTGNDFFGREHTLRTLLAAFRDGHSVGLFGLRRSGKTSVIREFKRRNESKGFSVVISDLEATGSLAELPAQICADLNATLRDLRTHDSSVWLGSSEEQKAGSFSELSTRIQKVAERNSRYRFVFAFDEIESLVPFVQSDPMLVRTFLGAVRRAAQGCANVCLLLTGVTSRFFRDSMLDPSHGIENPMFGFVDEEFLGPFDREETTDLLRKLGGRMTLTWDGDALTHVSEATGGFPFLVRDLASAARRVAIGRRADPEADANIRVTAAIVSSAYESWRDSAAELWAQIVKTLETHHELMAEMVRCRSESELVEWLHLGDDSDRAARSLAGLGLLTRAGPAWRLSDPLRSLQSLSRTATSELGEVRASARERQEQEAELRRLIRSEEGPRLEFKSSARVNVHSGRPDEAMKIAMIKTVAGFLNTDGGVLLIGVADDGTVIGVDKEIRATNNSRDKYLLHINNSLRNALGNPTVASSVTAELCDIDDATVCRVTVKPVLHGAWCEIDGNDVFYVRNGNQTVKVRNRDVADYLATRT